MEQSLCLNGEWDFMPNFAGHTLEELLKRDDWKTHKFCVPSSWRWMFDPLQDLQPFDLFEYPPAWNEAQSGLLRRRFSVSCPAGSRVWLVFHGILQRYTILVNGQTLVESSESFLPTQIDVTDVVNEGDDNEILVWCQPFEKVHTETGEKYLVPNGSWFAQLARGIWQDVFLEYRPEIYIEDIFIKTSTRQQHIDIEVTATNGSTVPFSGNVKVQMLDGTQPLKYLVCPSATLQPGEKHVFHLSSTWQDAIYWSPENPHLYQLEARLVESAHSQVLHKKTNCFGFREIWTEGHKFILNGIRTNLRGDAWHYQGFIYQTKEYALNWFKMCRQTGINFVRLHAMPYPEFFLDAADEIGMLIIDESAIYGSSKSTLSDDPRFIENCKDHLRRLVKRDRNHPSIIIWSMQNEMRWVDGRDGYRQAMPSLTQAIKELDDTRPVSYDGDNRLVSSEDCEIVSMHYNIDGTVASWEKDKPLIFGEHGPWHYVSPQTCSGLGGPQAYLSYEKCEESIGLKERLFLEYARREEVTGVTPFNIVNYCMWAFPEQEVRLEWADLSLPGPKAKRIPPLSLTVNNGQVKDAPLFIPNPSYQGVKEGFKPVTIFADEYDTQFFDGTYLERNFSIYNDTEKSAPVKLVYRAKIANGHVLAQGEDRYIHIPGERQGWQIAIDLPHVDQLETFTLSLELWHANDIKHTLNLKYQIYPSALKTQPLDAGKKRLAYYGSQEGFSPLSHLIPETNYLKEITQHALEALDVLILGPHLQDSPADIQLHLNEFVKQGGFLLVLEQDSFTLGDVTLSGRSFTNAFINLPNDPALSLITDNDISGWGPQNLHAPGITPIIENAFNRPAQGDLEVLLECGDGDFGWGGLLWSPLLAYNIGCGKVVLSQLALTRHFENIPQACQLLRGLLESACNYTPPAPKKKAALAAPANSSAHKFLRQIGSGWEVKEADAALIVVDPAELSLERVSQLRGYVLGGGQVLILPAEPHQKPMLSELAGQPVRLEKMEVYQLQALPHRITRGISPFDLSLIERVTYTPATYTNQIIADYALQITGAEPLLTDIHTPWVDFFIRGMDAEYHKVAIATRSQKCPFEAHTYAAFLPLGQGSLVFMQIKLIEGSDKVNRIYSRLLSNLGAVVNTPLLSYHKQDVDYAIQSFMALPRAPHQDYTAMLDYFRNPHYILNNLGEGVYGWMVRLEKRGGWIHIPDSQGKPCFLTVFVESETNRDPSKRPSHELPDPSIVPDFIIDTNCPFELYVNGKCFAKQVDAPKTTIKIEDVVLSKGTNRLLLVCFGGQEEVQLNTRFKDKFGEPVKGLKYILTLD